MKIKRTIILFYSLDTILLLKSRFLAGCVLILIGFILILLIFISCFLAKDNQTKQKNILTLDSIAKHKSSESRCIECNNKTEIHTTIINHTYLSNSK